MADREKVIKGLERCKLYNKVNCDKCPYDYNGRENEKSECTAELATDALAMLKDEKEYCNKCAESAIKTTVELQEEIARLRSLLKEQEGIIKQYQKADGFLFAHGWKWEGR